MIQAVAGSNPALQPMMKFTGICVDSGCIIIADQSYYNVYGPRADYSNADGLWKRKKIPNGEYKVSWEMKKTCHGNVKGTGKLLVTSGEIIVSDPCYLVGEEYWGPLLHKTDYLNDPEGGTVVLNKHGGDGCFTVYLELEKIQVDYNL